MASHRRAKNSTVHLELEGKRFLLTGNFQKKTMFFFSNGLSSFEKGESM